MTLDEARTYLAELESAILSGAQTVKITGPTGREVQYQSAEEMFAVANQLRRDIQRREGRPTIRHTVWAGSK